MDIGVGMLGQGFMGRAHALAIGRVATFEGLALRPRLVAIARYRVVASGSCFE